MTIVDVIIAETAGHEGNTAVVDGDRRITYGYLQAQMETSAAALARLGIKPLDRVALLARDSIEYIILSLAILRVEAVMVPIPTTYAQAEIEDVLEQLGANALIFEAAIYKGDSDKTANDAQALTGLFKDDTFGVKTFSPDVQLPEAYGRMAPAFVRFSSGTTGRNKGVVISHASIVARTDAAQTGLRISPDDVIIWVLDMSYHFVVTILLFLRKAATIVLCGQSFPASLRAVPADLAGTFIYAAPLHYNLLLQSDQFTRENLPAVRLAISTAMRQPVLDAERFFEKFGFELAEAFGIIEVGLPFINLSNDPAKRGSVGKILAGYELAIDAPDADGVGRILLKGDGMFDAYFSPWRLRAEALENGWFATGDLGRLDEDGFLFLSGREKNVINFAGMKIFPEEVEAVLNQHPDVKQARVYGLSHDTYGELPMADIVPVEGRTPDLTAIRRFCYSRLAVNKAPKKINVVAELPLTASGKLRRW